MSSISSFGVIIFKSRGTFFQDQLDFMEKLSKSFVVTLVLYSYKLYFEQSVFTQQRNMYFTLQNYISHCLLSWYPCLACLLYNNIIKFNPLLYFLCNVRCTLRRINLTNFFTNRSQRIQMTDDVFFF